MLADLKQNTKLRKDCHGAIVREFIEEDCQAFKKTRKETLTINLSCSKLRVRVTERSIVAKMFINISLLNLLTQIVSQQIDFPTDYFPEG
jgi:hypothetical protein